MAAIRQKKREEKRAHQDRERAKDVLGWRDVAAAQKKTTQQRQQEATRAAEEKKAKKEEAGVNMEKLEASLEQMSIKEHGVTTLNLRTAMDALSKAGVPNPLKGPNAAGILGIHIDEAEVCAKWEEIVTGQHSVIQAVAMCGDSRPGAGKLFLVVSEQEPLNKLSRDALMTYMKGVGMNHVKAADIEGITTTLRPGARDETVTNIFEIHLNLSEQLSTGLLTAIQGRRATISGIACTLALETSYSLNLTFGHEDRKKLGAVWKIMQAFDMDQDKLHLVVAAAVRKALALRSGSHEMAMAASMVGVALQRQMGPRGSKIRLSVRDIIDDRGPNFRVMFAKAEAPKAFLDLIVPIHFGQGGGLIWLEGMAQQHVNTGQEPGLEAAKARAQKRCTAILQEAERVLSEVEDTTCEEVGRAADEENAGAISASNITKVLSAITSLKSVDVTSDFVKEALMQALQEAGDHRTRCQKMLAITKELKVEVTRRRQQLSNPILVRMAPFPKLEEIHMQMGKLKSDIRMMNENSTQAAESWLRSLTLGPGATFSFIVAELVVTRGKPEWDNTAGIVVVCQAAQQLSGGLPVFQEAGSAAGETEGWKNVKVRQKTQGEKVATKINIQVMVGGKKPGASEKIRTKNQEVHIRMIQEEGDTLFAEEEKEAEKELLRRYAKEGVGVWVPLNWKTEEGEDKLTVFEAATGLPITPLSALPEFPELRFYIRNVVSELGRQKAGACDGVLGTLGEMAKSGEMLPVPYDQTWVIYMDPALARELYAEEMVAGEQMSEGEGTGVLSFVALGDDTSAVVWALAEERFFKCILQAAGEGVWIDWFPTSEPYDQVWHSVKLQEEAVLQGAKGSRWIGDICECAVVAMAMKHNDTALLRSCTETALREHSLRVLKGSEEVGLILHSSTLRSRQLRTEATMAGGGLPEIELTNEVVSNFESTCRKAAAKKGAMAIALVTRGDGPLSQVKAEWSEDWKNQPDSEVQLPTIVEVVEEEWKEQMTGTSAAAMLQEIVDKGTAIFFKTEGAYIIIFPGEVVSRDGLVRGATWQDQFGMTGEKAMAQVATRLRSTGRKTGRERGLVIQVIVQELSKAQMIKEIDATLNAGPCVIAGASAAGTGSKASLQAESWEGAMPEIDLRHVIRHPGAKDDDFLTEVMEGIVNNDVRYEAVNKGKGVLVLPSDPAERWNFSKWQAKDPRFLQWRPSGDKALETLSNMLPSAGEAGTNSGGKRTKDQEKEKERLAASKGDDEGVDDRDEGEERGMSRTKPK